MQQRLTELNKPALIFNVVNDALVNEKNAEQLQTWIKGESEVINLENSDHLLSKKQDTDFVAKEIEKWFLRQT